MAKNFKIYVSSFADRNAYARNGVVDVYLMGTTVFKEAKIIENATLLSELYSQPLESCTSGLFGCDERVVAPPPTCPGGGGTGPQGPAGPAGPTGPTGPAGPAGTGTSRIFCGYLEGSPPTPSGSFGCIQDIKGYVARKTLSCGGCSDEGAATGQIMNRFGFIPGQSLIVTATGGIVTGCNGEGVSHGSDLSGSGQAPSRHTVFRKTNNDDGSCYKTNQWTFGEYLKATGISDEQIPIRGHLENNFPGHPSAGQFIFIPVPPSYAFGDSQYIRLGDWGQLVQGNTAGTNGMYEELIDEFPECGPGSVPPTPIKADLGGQICATPNDAPPPISAEDAGVGNECNGGCSNGYPSCDPAAGGPKDGDIFIDATNGVMYIRSGGSFPTNGIPLGGEGDCNPQPCKDGPGGNGDGGGSGGLDCRLCGICGCDEMGCGCPEGQSCQSDDQPCCPDGQQCATPGCGSHTDADGNPCPCGGFGGGNNTLLCCPPGSVCAQPTQPCDDGQPPRCPELCEGGVPKVCPCPEGTSCQGPCPECPSCNSCCGTQTYSSSGFVGGL